VGTLQITTWRIRSRFEVSEFHGFNVSRNRTPGVSETLKP
jgi:hypothetical protein